MTIFRLIALLFAITTVEAVDTDRFGGFKGVTREASGYFRVEQINGRWFFITPEGHPYIALGGNHIGSFLKKQAAESGLLARHGDDVERAADALLADLRTLGLNAGDAYQPEPRFAEKLPWIKPFTYLPAPKKGWPDVFDETEMREMHDHVKKQCSGIAAQPWVIGVAGPDLPTWDSGFVHQYRLNPVGSPGRQGYLAFLKERHSGDITSVNAAYGTRFATWEALEKKPRLDLKIENDTARADDEAFLTLIASRHFAAVRSACKAGAPNHLYLGERTQLRVIPEGVLREMGRHIDVFCTQSLIRLPKNPPEWQVFQREHYEREFALVGKPMIIVDWAAPFAPGPEPLTTEYGTLKPEAEAAREAGQFVRDAFEPPFMVGLFICQVLGSHANDKWFGPEARRTYLRDDGSPFPDRAREIADANHAVLARLFEMVSELPQPSPKAAIQVRPE
jgi:hypothetical protein